MYTGPVGRVYYLQGFLVEKHPSGQGIMIVATDGHRMVIFYDADGTIAGPSQIVQLHDLKWTKRLEKNGICTIQISGDPTEKMQKVGYYVADYCELESNVKDVFIDGSYPEWRRVVPPMPRKTPKTSNIGFAPKCLADFGLIGAGIELHYTDDSSAVIVLANRADFLGVLMPMRVGADYPAFMK